jgi:hypothetical protein
MGGYASCSKQDCKHDLPEDHYVTLVSFYTCVHHRVAVLAANVTREAAEVSIGLFSAIISLFIRCGKENLSRLEFVVPA